VKKTYQLSEMRFIKRFVVGNSDPSNMKSEADIQLEMDKVNEALNGIGSSKGTIVGLEKSFSILNHGEHQIILQYFVYHIGFERKPLDY
jgi:hypothetical protein